MSRPENDTDNDTELRFAHRELCEAKDGLIDLMERIRTLPIGGSHEERISAIVQAVELALDVLANVRTAEATLDGEIGHENVREAARLRAEASRTARREDA